MQHKPLYDITKSFEYNLEYGPFFDGPIPARLISDRSTWRKIFDYEVMSPIGIAACPLTARARGISLVSRLGFDVITHKTIRSEAVRAHPWPNLGYVSPFNGMSNLAVTNSIGNASNDLEWHCAQIAKARSLLLPGQILIVSIFGTEVSGRTTVEDFAYLTARVIEAGAHAVELNFSCPNAQHGILFEDEALSFQIVRACVAVAGAIPVIAKVGLFKSKKDMHTFLRTIAHAGARGIIGINTVPTQVLNDAGEPFFGESRKVSGLSGAPIFNMVCKWIESAAEIIAQEKLDVTLFATGGITTFEQFTIFLNHGADVALTATGALWDPYLAHNYRMNYENAIQRNEPRRVVDSAL